jgi:hypothetical protein
LFKKDKHDKEAKYLLKKAYNMRNKIDYHNAAARTSFVLGLLYTINKKKEKGEEYLKKSKNHFSKSDYTSHYCVRVYNKFILNLFNPDENKLSHLLDIMKENNFDKFDKCVKCMRERLKGKNIEDSIYNFFD